ncbi:MAG: BspA family leucine-rich repeat surface protein, partial [Clostridiales bacterium]|nr:BspA family leucine-rich repeat surface protein [Clostridiales bacterium]
NMFCNCYSLTNLDVSGFDTSNVTSMKRMFYNSYNCSSLTNLDVSGFDTSSVTDMSYMFYACGSLTNLDVSGFNTSNVIDMSGMFGGCYSLTNLDVSGFDTSNVTSMKSMFEMCTDLTSLDVSGFDTSSVTEMGSMFAFIYNNLTSLDVSSFDTSNVTDMSSMFYYCSVTSLDLSGFDTSNVTDMSYMFRGCDSLTSLDLSSFDTSSVTSIGYMLTDYTDELNWVKIPAYFISDIDLPLSYDDDYWLDGNGEVCTVIAGGLTTSMKYSRKSYLDANPDDTSDEGYTITVMANSSNCSTEIGDDLLLSFVLFEDGEALELNNVIYEFTWDNASDTSDVYTYTGEVYIDSTEYDEYWLNRRYYQFNANAVGEATLNVTAKVVDLTAEAGYSEVLSFSIPVSVYEDEKVCFDEISVLYTDSDGTETNYLGEVNIDNFTWSYEADRSCSVSFDAYNAANFYGAVCVYDANDELTDTVIIKKFESYATKWLSYNSEEGITSDLWDKLSYSLINIASYISGNVNKYNWYRAEESAEKTEISVTVPEGGYITISTSMEDPVVWLYNTGALTLELYNFASGISINADVKEQVAEEIVDKAIEKVGFDYISKFTKKLLEKFAEEGLTSSLEDAYVILDANSYLMECLAMDEEEYAEMYSEIALSTGLSVISGVSVDSILDICGLSAVKTAIKTLSTAYKSGNLIEFFANYALNTTDSSSGMNLLYYVPETNEMTEVDVTDNCTVELEYTSAVYTGKSLCPDVTVKSGSTILTESTDYNVSYSNNINAGTATVTVTGIGNYSGTTSKTFTITKASQTVTASAGASSIYAGKTTTVTGKGTGTITYSSSDTSIATVSSAGKVTGKKPGTVKITVKAAGNSNYSSATKTVSITVKLASPTVSSVVQFGSNVTVKWGKVTGAGGYYVYRSTSSGSGYSKVATITNGSTVSWKDTASKANGKTYYYKVYAYNGSTKSAVSSYKSIKYMKGTVSSLTNKSAGITVKWSKVSGATGYYVYRKASGASSYTKVKTITSGSTVSYIDTAVKSKNGTTYIYYVQPYNSTSKGAYATKKTVRLTGASLLSVKNSAAKKMTVMWSKKSGVSGYQIQYSTSSSFSSGNKTVTVSGASATSKVISSLTKKKTYYVRIRTYKTVSGTKYYSAWSSTKKVKISK